MSAFLAALVLGTVVSALRADAATTTYSGTTGPITIEPGDTALLINGADITGDVTNNGTLQFGLTDNLTVSNTVTIAGSGDVLLSASGTVTFSGSNSYLNGTTVRYGELVIVSGGAVDHPDASMTVGSQADDIGTLRITGGSVTNSTATLGKVANSTGSAFISGGMWTNSSDLLVGGSGTGLLTITGGRVSNTNAQLGQYAGAVGTAAVSSGTWSSTGELSVGYYGAGSLTISGGNVSTDGSMFLGRDVGGVGDLTVTSGTLDVGSALQVGFGGVGRLLVNGGKVTSVDAYIGLNSTSSGTATITSGTWLNTGNMYISQGGGAGVLNISNSGVVIVGGLLDKDPLLGTINLDLGGTLVIGTGTDSGVLATDLTNDGTVVFDRSTDSAYEFAMNGTGFVLKRGAGTLLFTGSNSYTGGTTILDGRIQVQANAAINHPSAILAIGDAGGASGGLDVIGGSVTSSLLNLYNGDVSLSSNGHVTTGTTNLGLLGTGSASITGGLWETEALYVGSGGTGTLDVTGGGLVTLSTVLGVSGTDSGTVNVTTTGTWLSRGNLTVGGGGYGALTIADGGDVVVTGTLAKGPFGTINLNTGGILQIGDGGTTGTLATDLVNGGLLVFDRSNDSTYVGQISGAGAVTKSGDGALTFTGSNSYTGATTIESGAFYVNGQLGDTAVAVSPGALLGGNGIISGDVTIGDPAVTGTAVISPGSDGDQYASLAVKSLSLTAGSLTQLEVSGTTAGLDYDQIAGVAGAPRTITYGGDLALTFSGSYADGTTFELFSNFTVNPSRTDNFNGVTMTASSGPFTLVSGTFTYLETMHKWVSDWTSNNQRLEFSTVSGNLVVVPEPATFVLAALGVGLGGVMRWRRRRRSAPAEAQSTEAPPATPEKGVLQGENSLGHPLRAPLPSRDAAPAATTRPIDSRPAPTRRPAVRPGGYVGVLGVDAGRRPSRFGP